MIKRQNAEKKTCTQSYHFSVDRKWQFGGVVPKSKQIPHVVAGIMSAPTPHIVSLSWTWKDELFFILNRIKANHLDITYILSVLQLYVVIVGEVKVEGLDCLSFLCGVCVCVCACTVLITCCVSLAACKLNCFLYINGPRILEAEGQSRYQV